MSENDALEHTSASEGAREEIGKKAAIAAAAGTAVEYYEFCVYGYMAATIAPLFFPNNDPSAALLASLAVFGSAFLIRHLGGVLLGRLGDRIGRRGELLATVIGMGVSTTMIGLLPTSQVIGIWTFEDWHQRHHWCDVAGEQKYLRRLRVQQPAHRNLCEEVVSAQCGSSVGKKE